MLLEKVLKERKVATIATEEWRLLGAKAAAGAERANIEAENAAEMALLERQAALNREEKERINLQARTSEANDALERQKLDNSRLQREL